MKQLLPAFALMLFFGLAVAQQATESDASAGSGDVVLFLFDGDEPVAGAQLIVDGSPVATTGDDGGLFTSLSAGRHKVVIQRDGETVLDLDLLTADGEQIQLIATLKQGGKPDINIESTGTGPVLAEDAEQGQGQNEGDGDKLKAGLLKGTIVGAGGAAVADARVLVPSRGRAVRTDDDGLFQIELPPGNYSIKVSHPDYSTQTLDNLRVIPGKSVTADLSLGETGVQLAEYVVTGTYVEGSIASELSIQRESPQVVSVIGAEQISRTGDSDAAEALQRVSGLVIEDGKFVVIRGQPFRYTLSQFNGLPLPSPDPIIQAVPLDLFPESILANIQVQKSYSVDQPGDFGAGLIGLNTRATPDEPFFQLEVSTGGNDFSTGKTGLTYDGSDEDFLGQDGGDRELPNGFPSEDEIDNLNVQQRQEVGRSFNDLVLVQTQELPADIGFEAVGGRSFATDYGTFGVIATGTYDQKYRREFETDFTYLTSDLSDPRLAFNENRTDREVQISSLLGLSANWDNHSVVSNTFFIRDSQDRTQVSEGLDETSGGREERRFLLEFQRRELRLTQLIGEHDFDAFEFDWRVQTADTTRDRPDRRDYSYQRTSGSNAPLTFFADDGLNRQFNVVDENLNSGALDFTIPLPEFAEITAAIETGLDITERERDSSTRNFQFEPRGLADTSDPLVEQVINDQTIDDDADVVQFTERTLGTDAYTADVTTRGVYLGSNLRYRELVQFVGGLRATNGDFDIVTANGATGGFDEDFLLPALSLTGFVTPDMQLRAAYSETVSYPRLVELSATTFFDPDTGEGFIGNPELEPTEITSYDLRWEWYPTAVEALTAGLYYKELTNTIEQQFLIVAGGGTRTTFVNGESGDILGLEIGGRLGLGRIFDLGLIQRNSYSNWLSQAYIQANATISDSSVDTGGAGAGAATNQVRALNGQADNTVNLQLGYDGPIHDITFVVNRVGERLDRAGVDGRPDVFQEPTTLLDLTYSLTIPDELPFIGKIPYIGAGRLKLKAQNLLDEDDEFRQGGVLQRRITYGRSFSGSLKWNFF